MGIRPADPAIPVSRVPEIVLLLVTFVWGGTFLVSQTALSDGGPFALLAVRFTVGSAVLCLLFHRRLRDLTRTEFHGGLAIGVVTFGSFALQTTGLQYVPSSTSAFITALYVPVVPLLQLVILGLAPRTSAWAGIAVSFSGLIVLSSGGGLIVALDRGEWLTLGGAFGAALQIILVSRWAPRCDPMRLAIVQLAVVAVMAAVAMPIAGEPLPSPTPRFLLGSAALGVLGTAFALSAMNWAQRTISATRATIIYAMEPVWGGIFGALAGEAMTGRIVTGSSLIILGVLVSEMRWVSVRGPTRSARPARREAPDPAYRDEESSSG